MDVKAIGEKIKKQRMALGMTQKQLAQLLSVSNQLVSKWENGESVPSLEYLDSLCRALGVGYSYFTGDDNTGSADEPGSIEDGAQAESNELPQQDAQRAKVKRKFNWRLFLLITGSVFGVLLIAAVTLLSYYVFVPLANKKKYINSIEQAGDKYLELGYYSVNYKTEVDGDVKSDYTFKGYLNADGSVAFYNSQTQQTVVNGFLTYDYDDNYFYKYIQNTEYSSLEEMMWAQIFPDDKDEEDDDERDVEKDIKYIRKVKDGYYIEFKDEFFTDELTGTQKKNYKLLDKIKGNVKLNDGLFSAMSITVKYRNKPENENFTIKVTIEFDTERPVIEHVNFSERELYGEPVIEYPGEPADPLDKYPLCENKVSRNEFVSRLSDGKAKKAAITDGDDDLTDAVLQGRFYKIKSNKLIVYNPEDFKDKTEIEIGDNADVRDTYLYNGQIYCAFNKRYDYYYCWLSKYDLTTGEWRELFDYYGSYGERLKFNGKYVGYYYSGKYIVYDLAKEKSVLELSNSSLYHIDSAGNAYCEEYVDGDFLPVAYIKGKRAVLEGNDYYSKYGEATFFGDVVYTVDTRNAYTYEKGVYKETIPLNDVRFKDGYRALSGGGYCFASDYSFGDKQIYADDGQVKDVFTPVTLLDGEEKIKVDCNKIIETFGNYILVELYGYDKNFLSKYYLAVYDAGDLTKPLYFTDRPDKPKDYNYNITEVKVCRTDDYTIFALHNDADFALSYDIWIIKEQAES